MDYLITAPKGRNCWIALGTSNGADPLFLCVAKGESKLLTITPEQKLNLEDLMASLDWIPKISVRKYS